MVTRPVAIVTGAGGGIGTAIACKLAAQGWHLVLADRTESEASRARDACERSARPSPDAERAAGFPQDAAVDIAAGDAADPRTAAALVDTALRRHGRLDGFVANAGVPGVVRPMEDYPDDIFRQVLDVNVVGTYLCLKHALPALRRHGGSFVAMGSTSSIRGRAHLAAYVASKHAVLGLVRTAALECAGSDVRVNAVLPGPTQTAMIEAIDAMAAQARADDDATGSIGIARAVRLPYGRPEDVANTVAFLLCAESRHINGAALVVDAGSTVA
ncbi:SDR family NAD(P)-dependent oxidoreductase [Bordetella flabilis]|uniref:Oxidoreductase n=1 Tax=Bordetella flabilis TaxID=463014 RepID=A0A193GI56_9BORD|nr:SDR family oxidoreductase [Bordetella flabilis]ANN78959.1 oxidoreductase [Bordetella flabilis]